MMACNRANDEHADRSPVGTCHAVARLAEPDARRVSGQVLGACHLRNFLAGDHIYRIGDEPGGMYGLLRGGLKVDVDPSERGSRFAHFARPGAWFGEAAAFTRQPRRIGLSASRPSQLLHLPLNAIDAIVRRSPDAWRLFGLNAIINLDLAMSGADDLMLRDPAKKCAAILLRLGDCRYESHDEEMVVEIDIRQEDIASTANLSRNATGTILRRFEARGLIGLAYRTVKILDADGLRNFVNSRRRGSIPRPFSSPAGLHASHV